MQKADLAIRAPSARRAHARSVPIAIALALVLSLMIVDGARDASAKSPGRVYCYHGICHRVHALDEVTRLIGHIRHETASYYASAGRYARTSSGENFDAGSRNRVSSSIYPDGTELLLWNPVNGRAAHVRVNDLGPFHGKRTLDLTQGLADDLGLRKAGAAQLKVFVIAAPDAREAAHNRRRSFAPTTGYLGSLDETRAGDLADDLVDQAIERRDPPSAAIIVAAPAPPVADALEIATAPAPPAPPSISQAEHTSKIAAPTELTLGSSRSLPAETSPAVGPEPVVVAASAAPAPAPASVVAAPRMATPAAPMAALSPSRAGTPATNSATPLVFLTPLLLSLLTLHFYRLSRQQRAAPVPLKRTATASQLARGTVAESDPLAGLVLRRVGGEPSGPPMRPIATTAANATRRSMLLLAARRHAAAGRYADAETAYCRLIARLEASHGPSDCALARPMMLWADCVRDSGRLSDALQIYDRALQLAGRACAPDAPETAAILSARARLHLDRSAPAAALDDATAAADHARGAGAIGLAAGALLLLAEAAHALGDATLAESTLSLVIEMQPPELKLAGTEAAVLKAALLAARGANADALAQAESALAALDRHLAIASPPLASHGDLTDRERHIDRAIAARRAALELIGRITPDRQPPRHVLASLIAAPKPRLPAA